VRRRAAAAAAAVAALAAAGNAVAGLPSYPSGSVIGEGIPFKAYASVTPVVHLFGDEVTARLAVVADTRWVDPSRLRIRTDFAPYTSTRPPVVLRVHAGRFEQMTWTWTLRCIASPCVPRAPPSERFHVFRFRAAAVDYVSAGGKRLYGRKAGWPSVEVISQITPLAAFFAATNQIHWQLDLTPVASPTYGRSPALLFWLALGLAGVLSGGALVLARNWYLAVRPARAAVIPGAPANTLERALILLRWAHEHGDETLQRKAFERVAGELGIEAADELTRTARELAWSPRTPEDEEVEDFAEQALERSQPEE
jgi:hypothetical protein